MRYFSSLAVKNLTVRRVRTVLTALGITLGVAVILAIDITDQTALSSYQQMLATVSGKADLQITAASSTGFDEKTLNKIRQTKGVKSAAPLVSYFTFIVKGNNREKIRVFGVDPKVDKNLRQYTLLHGSFLKHSDEHAIVLVEEYARKNKLRLGQRVSILTPQGLVAFRVVGLIEKTGAGMSQNGKVGYIPLPIAQQAFELQGKIQAADIEVRADVNRTKKRLAKKLGQGFSVERPAAKSKEVEGLLEATKFGFDFFSVLALFVGGFLIFNTFSMNIAERVPEIGIIRSVGATRTQIAKIVLLEALVLGSIGCLLGVGLGINLAKYTMKTMTEYVHSELGVFVVPISSIIISVAIGLVATIVSSLQPALRASRISPLAAVQERGRTKTSWLEKTGWIGGIFLIPAGIGIACVPFLIDAKTHVQEVYYQFGALIMFSGIALTLPIIVSPLSYVCHLPLASLLGTEGKIAQRNIERRKTRTALTIVTVVVGLIMIVGIDAMNLSYKKAIETWVNTMIGADLFIHSDLAVGVQMGKTVPMSIRLRDEIKKTEGVKGATPVKIMPVDMKERQIKLVAVDPVAYKKVSSTQFIEGDEDKAIQKQTEGKRQVFASTVLKEKLGYKIGDKISLKTNKGWKKFTIIGIISDFTSNQGTVRISWKDLNEYFGINDADSYDIKVVPGYSVAEVKKKLEQEIVEKYDLEIWTSSKFRAEVNKEVDRMFGLMNAIVLIAILVAILAVINTLFMNILERTHEIGILRATGATRYQIAKVVVTEAAFMGIIGGAFGALCGIIASVIMVRASIQQTGYPLSYYFPSLSIAWVMIGGILISIIAALYPAQKAARLDVTKALQYE